MSADDIEIIVNEDRPGFVDYTFKKGDRKVYLFEVVYGARQVYDPLNPFLDVRVKTYAVYAPRPCVYTYFKESLLSAQAYAFEILSMPCWAPVQGPRFPPDTINTRLRPIWRNW